MLTLRRFTNISHLTYRLTFYRYKSKKSSTDDESTPNSKRFNEELINFDRKNINRKQSITNEKLFDNHRENPKQRRKYNEERDRSLSINRVNLAKPFNAQEKQQKREEQLNEQKQKKSHPQVILDTESNDVKILTRQIADSLTPPSSPYESSNIEQELLDVLRGHRVVSKTARRIEKSDKHSQQKSIDDNKISSSKQQRTQLSSDSENDKTSEAFSSLLRDIKLKSTRSASKTTLEDEFIQETVSGSKVRPRFTDDREQKRENFEPRRTTRDTKRRQEFMKPQKLWSGEPLGIFNSKDFSSKVSSIWEQSEQDQLKRISSIPPRNAFEEMIQWTKDGILWKFPIDNEQDIGPEADVPFYEHVLLERHLHDFPNSPLIRQFMELVCVGLGRNPYWTVEQKVEHINWFRNYFNEKMNILNETVHTGTIKTTGTSSSTKTTSTYKPKTVTTKANPVAVPPTASKN